jgi:hypothetical protein
MDLLDQANFLFAPWHWTRACVLGLAPARRRIRLTHFMEPDFAYSQSIAGHSLDSGNIRNRKTCRGRAGEGDEYFPRGMADANTAPPHMGVTDDLYSG